jgi:penicillin G amidase
MPSPRPSPKGEGAKRPGMRVARLVAKAFGALVLLLLLMVVAGWFWLRGSLPVLDGERKAAVQAPVEIVRDAEGVPHIYAASERDGWFAMGYVHAQDRLWQMEFQRRVGQGRIAEVLGERAFETDRLMRTLGFARLAERIEARLDAETRGHLAAYAAGVNAYLDEGRVLPIEFQALRVEPEPWKAQDSVAWLLVMAWDLSGNWRAELGRLRFAAKLGRERAAEFLPPYPGDPAVPLPDFKSLYAELAPQANQLLALSPPHEESIGSNNWAVSGRHAKNGKPLVANDPHLGLQAPALWYLAHVATPAGNVVGGTLPGVPFVVIGRNDHVAWSFTTTNSDTQDLFVEKLLAGDASRYVTRDGAEAFEVREEVIRVGSEERRVTVRSTRHGPVLSDAVKGAGSAAPAGHVLALAWTALTEENTTARAGFLLNRARNRDELLAAARDFVAPHQNIVFADARGGIGFIAPARVPVRHADNEASGRVPVPGWVAKYDWAGILPFEELPQVMDPPEGRLVTANHKVTPPGYRPFISVDWFPPYRADRIEALLAAEPAHSLDTFARLQADSVSRLAVEVLPFALAAHPGNADGRELQAMLRGWNGDMAVDSPAALAYAAWYRELTRLVYADELGELFPESWDQRAAFMIAVLRGEGGLARWCDDITTAGVETCDQLSGRALELAAAELRERYGDPKTWSWGRAHQAAGDHRPFGFFPVLPRWFNVSPPTPGDAYAVNVGHYFIRDAARPFHNRHAASLRVLFDFADLDTSRYMHSTGQSGNVFSPWYSNLAQRWARVEYITIPTKRDALRAAYTRRLLPRG